MMILKFLLTDAGIDYINGDGTGDGEMVQVPLLLLMMMTTTAALLANLA